MKLLRIGPSGHERPMVLDDTGMELAIDGLGTQRQEVAQA